MADSAGIRPNRFGWRPAIRPPHALRAMTKSAAGISDEYWRDECDKLIRALRDKTADDPHSEQRGTPRYAFDHTTLVQVSGPPAPYRIVNISSGGVAILTDHRLGESTRLMLSIKNSVYVEVEVLGSDIIESDTTLMEFAYKTRCRFLNEQDGTMAFVVMAGID
jgi:hypothetical protein